MTTSPWYYLNDNDSIYGERGDIVARVYGDNDAQAKANAVAIAAVPELVAALRRVADWRDDEHRCSVTVAMHAMQHEARAALAKACQA
jgi:hypothetical protein